MYISIGADHLGEARKNELIDYLKENDINVNDINIKNHPLDDYPDFAFEVGRQTVKNNGLGIVICGNGIGVSIAANKVKGVRAARVLCVDDAFKCKNHNAANVIALSSETSLELTEKIVDAFITTKSADEERFLRRVNKIINYEGK